MIEAKDLRIDNWVIFEGRYFQIDCIAREAPFLKTSEFGVGIVEYKNIEPIPLTPEILEKCGFEWDEIKMYNDDRPLTKALCKGRLIMLNVPTNPKIWYAAPFGYPISANRTIYLHQLQNLYFALTGDELTINL